MWFFEVPVYRPAPQEMFSFQTGLVEAYWEHWPLTVLPTEVARQKGVIVNVATFDGIATIDRWLLCTEEIVDLIASRCAAIRAVARPVNVVSAYRYPSLPNDLSYMEDSAYDSRAEFTKTLLPAYVKKYACAVPKSRFVILEVVNSDEQSDLPKDFMTLVAPRSPESPSLENTCCISPSFVQKHGIVWAKGYWCHDEVWQVIAPFLTHPAWCCQSYKV